MRCTIWYHLYNLKNVKNTHGEVLVLVKLQALACTFTKSNTPPWVFFTLFKLYKWYQIAQASHMELPPKFKKDKIIIFEPLIQNFPKWSNTPLKSIKCA